MSGSKVDGLSTLVRPKFAPGMLLQHDDLDQLANYTRDLSRLLFRSFFGCGVICGLEVTPSQDKCGVWQIVVTAGVALDCSGDPIYVPKDQTLALDDTCDPTIKEAWVILCSKTKNCAPRTAMCPNDEDDTTSICTRERDAFEIRVVSDPGCACGCPDRSPDNNATPCQCADPTRQCQLNLNHYQGKCSSCTCGCGGGCSDADCVILAYLSPNSDSQWEADYSARRFIRPVLMRDPLVPAADSAKAEKATGPAAGPPAAVPPKPAPHPAATTTEHSARRITRRPGKSG